MKTLTIEALISQGKEILDGIKYMPPPSCVTRLYSVYKLADESAYECWKNIVIRFLSSKYKNDISVSDFRVAMEEFEKNNYNPSSMKKMLGILEAYIVIPSSITPDNSTTQPTIVINNSNSQTQNQEQNFDIFIKSIEDSFTISQIKELKQIVDAENGNMERAKSKIIEKIKSFGANLAPSLVANIITNPSIWASIYS